MSVVVVPTGTANLASVLAGLRRTGADPTLANAPEQVERADRVVVPGVGTFGAAVSALESAGLGEPVARRIADGRPTLAVCVGMQILATASDESPGNGLGVVDARVRRFDGEVRIPQLGWNHVEPQPGARFVTPGWAYFANSYRLDTVPQGWVGATSDHGGPFVAAMERGDVLACQFHPELSGSWGLALLERWLAA